MADSIHTRLQALERRKRERSGYTEAVDVAAHIAPVYLPLHDDILSGGHQYYNLPGGRGSCKSSFVSLEIISGVMSDETGNSNAIVFRRVSATMRESVFAQMSWAIAELGVSHLWRGSVSPMQYTYTPTGAQVIFRGLDDPMKLKSIKPRKGIFRFVWFEEFAELPGANLQRNVLQSVVRGGNNFAVFRSFNPPISKNNWANLYIQEPDPHAITLKTDYTMIPPAWLGDAFLYEAQRLQEVNPAAYLHEYMGEATGSGGEVFPNITVRQITDKEINELQYIYAGLDFGFSIDPCAFVRVAYDRKHDTLYLLDEIYKKHLSNAQLAAEIKEKGFHLTGETYSSLYGGQYGQQRALITADSAEPKSINDLQNEGLKVIACHKYPGSVLYGIKWLQSRKIIIDPARTPNAHREFVGYEYQTTRDGEFLADVPDKDNHTIDAVRYACDRLINNRGVSA